MAMLETEGAVVHYTQTGSGPDIVWIPGGDQTGDDMRWQVEGFADHRNLAFDPRGAGRTEVKDPPPWTLADYAADAIALIEALCEPPVVLAGLSMGSMIVQETVLRRPDLVRAAIPMGTAGRCTGFLREWMESEVRYRREHGDLPPDFAVTHYGAFMYPPEVLGDDAEWARLKEVTKAAYEHRDGRLLDAQWQACIDVDTLDRLPDCDVPVHVIAFSHDMQAPPGYGRRVAEAARHGHFHLLEGLSHLSICGHRPDVVNAKIREILASLD